MMNRDLSLIKEMEKISGKDATTLAMKCHMAAAQLIATLEAQSEAIIVLMFKAAWRAELIVDTVEDMVYEKSLAADTDGGLTKKQYTENIKIFFDIFKRFAHMNLSPGDPKEVVEGLSAMRLEGTA